MKLSYCIDQLVKRLPVRGVLAYGSYALGLQDRESDIDLLVIVDAEVPAVEIRQEAYRTIEGCKIDKIDFTAAPGGDIGCDWDNSWSPVNDRLLIENQVVEIGYNRAAWVETVLDKLLVEHRISFAEFPFRPYTFLGLLDYSKILYDKDSFLQNSVKRIHPIPKELKEAIWKVNFASLVESYTDYKSARERNVGILATSFFLFRAIDAATTLLFLHNDRYDPAAKRVEALLFQLPKLPAHFKTFIEQDLTRYYENHSVTSARLQELISFLKPVD